MTAFNDKRRDIKRAYRKKAFQNDMSLVRNTVDNRPLPEHSYSTPSHQQTAPVRRGIDAHTYVTDVRPAVEHLDFARMLDSARFPWHLFPKGDSANVISRGKYDFTGAGADVADGEYVDVLVLNVADASGSQSPGPAAIPGPAPSPASETVYSADGSQTGSGNPSHPNRGGNTITGVQGSVNIGAPGEIYRIGSFGHSEVSTANQTSPNQGGFTAAAPLRYQIWIDGTLFMEWQNFQWSPVTPLQSQWNFTQPLTVTEQIVFRILNQTGYTLNVGDMEVCFNGWSEQLSGYVDVAYQQLENN